MNFRLTFYTSGILLMLFALVMLVPAFIDWARGDQNASAFFESALFCGFFGIAFFCSNRGMMRHFNIREGFAITSVSWMLMCVAGALPLYFSDLGISFADAFFESASGVTTTGSTVLSGLDGMSHGVLLWRSMLQWIGGIGIIAFAIVLLPFLKIGGMELFQTESSDRSDKALPQARGVVERLVIVYIGLTAACLVTYYAMGMSIFDAVNHAMTTLSTGGFSTHDKSFGYFESMPMQLAATVFMFLGGVPFILFVKALFLGRYEFMKDQQVCAYIGIVGAAIVAISLWLYFVDGFNMSQSFVFSAFNVVSVVTTTGYATADYIQWGTFTTMMFFFLTYLGGCAGSTSGGLKMMRIVVLFQAIKQQINKYVFPSGVFTPRYQGSPLSQNLIIAVFSFLALYVFLNVFLTILLTWMGLDFETAVSASVTAIANVGPGIGEIIGPAGNFAELSDAVKWILAIAMVLGRLEILTVAVMFSPHFWEKGAARSFE